MITFRGKASNVLRLVDEPGDNLGIPINKVNKRIANKIKAIPRDRFQYGTWINSKAALNYVS